jgi:hypothetical protein
MLAKDFYQAAMDARPISYGFKEKIETKFYTDVLNSTYWTTDNFSKIYSNAKDDDEMKCFLLAYYKVRYGDNKVLECVEKNKELLNSYKKKIKAAIVIIPVLKYLFNISKEEPAGFEYIIKEICQIIQSSEADQDKGSFQNSNEGIDHEQVRYIIVGHVVNKKPKEVKGIMNDNFGKEGITDEEYVRRYIKFRNSKKAGDNVNEQYKMKWNELNEDLENDEKYRTYVDYFSNRTYEVGGTNYTINIGKDIKNNFKDEKKYDYSKLSLILQLHAALKMERNNSNHAVSKGRLPLADVKRAMEIYVRMCKEYLIPPKVLSEDV